MRVHSRSVVALLLVVLSAGCAAKHVQDAHHNLAYTPMTTVTASISDAMDISVVEVTDGRAEKGIIGTRSTEKTNDRANILMAGDITTWGIDAARDILGKSGIVVGVEKGAVLRITIRQIDIREVVYVQAEYEATVVLGGTLLIDGVERWSGSGRGTAQNYGRPASDVNYAETLNHAMGRALAHMFDDTRFQEEISRGS